MPLPWLLVVCWQFLVFLGLQKHHPDLCLYLHKGIMLIFKRLLCVVKLNYLCI